jgi:lipoprotein-anchoring transpeptidase ErfK/SrfK
MSYAFYGQLWAWPTASVPLAESLAQPSSPPATIQVAPPVVAARSNPAEQRVNIPVVQAAPPASPVIATDVPTAIAIPTLPPPTATPEPPTAVPPTEEPPTAVPPTEEPVVVAPYTGRSIVVSLSNQWLYAYEGGVQIFDAPVSTGRDGFNTPVGDFAIYTKLPVQTMSGNLGGEEYYVPDVPHVMYIYGGVALHGTYWHEMFGTGTRMSHGCINLPLWAAEWVYNWSDVGTPVSVVW